MNKSARLREVKQWLYSFQFSRYQNIISLFVFIIIVILFVLIWNNRKTNVKKDLMLKTSLTAQQITLRLHDNISAYLNIVEVIEDAWLEEEINDEQRFKTFALRIHKYYPGFQAINYIDTAGVIRWVTPEKPNLPAKDKDLHTHPFAAETFVYSEKNKIKSMTPPIELWQGGKGFAIYNPIIRDGKLEGYINAVFRIRHFLNQSLNKGIAENFDLELYDGVKFYSISSSDNDHSEIFAEDSLKILNRTWVLRLRPSKKLISSAFSPLDEIVLGLGILLAALVAFLVRFQLQKQRELHQSINLLRESEEKYRAFIDNFEGIAYLKSSKRDEPLIFQGAIEKITGYSDTDFLSGGIKWEELIHPYDRTLYKSSIIDPENSSGKNKANRISYRIIDRDRKTHWIDEINKCIEDQSSGELFIYGSIYDTTQITLTQIALRESEEKYRSIVENSIIGIFMIQEERVVFCNRRLCDIFGLENEMELLGKEFQSLFDTESKQKIRELLKSSDSDSGTPILVNGLTKDGNIITIELSGNWIIYNEKMTFQGTIQDITEKFKLEKQIQQSRRLESIGMLASGIAHDFNNVLTAIIGSAEMTLFDLPSGHPARHNIKEIIGSVQNAANLTRQLLTFSSKQPINPEIVPVNSIIRNLNKMLNRLISENIELQLNLSESAGYIKADPGQIEQILVNLVVNARDAIQSLPREKTEKKIIINTRDFIPDEKLKEQHNASGNYVCIEVSDTGIGIRSEDLPHIFDPFYTSKDSEHGTGLGLSTVYGIVKQNNGIVEVDSKPGEGTTFRIFWKKVSPDSEPDRGKNDYQQIQGGNETILLVEDDASIRRTYTNILNKFGYKVLSAVNGKEALKMVAMIKDKIDLLFTDVVMPEMDGIELVTEIRLYFPEVKILYTSGFYEQQKILEEDTLIHFLQKPFNQQKLLKTIREILDE